MEVSSNPEGLIGFIQNNSTLFGFCLLYIGMALLLVVERLIPDREIEFPQKKRKKNNIILSFINIQIILGTSLIVTLGLLLSTSLFSTNLMLSSTPKEYSLPAAILIILCVTEFVQYWLHRAMHHFPFLWRIHAVHHSDIEVDVTTSYRHHPAEAFLTVILLMPISMTILIFFRLPLEAVLISNSVQTIVFLFSHSNIKVPQIVDKFLRLWIVTPSFHIVHHFPIRSYHDSNYGSVLPWFDCFFRTYRKVDTNQKPPFPIGLKGKKKFRPESLHQMIRLPFNYFSWIDHDV